MFSSIQRHHWEKESGSEHRTESRDAHRPPSGVDWCQSLTINHRLGQASIFQRTAKTIGLPDGLHPATAGSNIYRPCPPTALATADQLCHRSRHL
jgi:hypothetical protein